MPDRMLTLDEARAQGFDPDPLVFHECTERVPTNPHTETVRYYQSRFYFVGVQEIVAADGMEMTWLSIRRNDRKAMQDWRHLQRIKNEMTDPDREAVQVYPAEDRLIDESNQMHLWVYPKGYILPYGYAKRSVITRTELEMQYEHLKRMPGMRGNLGKPEQRAFDKNIEAKSRSEEEMIDDLINNDLAIQTIHRKKEEA